MLAIVRFENNSNLLIYQLKCSTMSDCECLVIPEPSRQTMTVQPIQRTSCLQNQYRAHIIVPSNCFKVVEGEKDCIAIYEWFEVRIWATENTQRSSAQPSQAKPSNNKNTHQHVINAELSTETESVIKITIHAEYQDGL